MARIELDHVTKRYPGGVSAVNDLSLDVPDGDFMVFVGPSGSGKSTALRMIAGLEDLTSGELRIGGRAVNDLPPKDRDIAVTFADHKLPVPDRAVAEHPGLNRFLDRQVIIGLRPSSFEDAVFAPKGWPRLKAEPKVTELLGSEVDVIFAVKSPPAEHQVLVAQFDTTAKQEASEDQDQAGGLVGEGEGLWTARVNPRSSVRPGRAVDLAVDPSALYWFDPDSDQAVPRQAAGDRPSGTQQAAPPQQDAHA